MSITHSFAILAAHPFMWNVLLLGVAIAVMTAPLGCFVLWQRMHYVGDALAHATLLGVVLAVALDMPIFIGVFALCCFIALSTSLLQTSSRFSSEGLVALAAYMALALALVIISLYPSRLTSVLNFVFGDILAVSHQDIAGMYVGAFLVCLWSLKRFKAFTLYAVSPELAFSAGYNVRKLRLEFMLILALAIALAIKVVGVLLMSALLIIPAHIGRIFAKTPGQMYIATLIASIVSVIIGVASSLLWDIPTSPAIIVAASALFCIFANKR